MLIQGSVISYTPSTKVNKQGGGTYDAWELVYRNNSNEVKSVIKPATGLRFNPSLKNGLAALSPGDQFTLVMEKEGEFWNPKSVEKGIKDVQDVGASGPAQAAAKDGNRAPAREGKVTGSNYETPEERAKKQVVIVRQGVLNAAIELLKANKVEGVVLSHEAAVEVAKEFEKYVYKDLSKLAKKYIEVTLKEEE